MAVINEYKSYCAVCGGPIEDFDVDNALCYLQSTDPCWQSNQLDHGWLSQAVLLHSITKFSENKIYKLSARSIGGPYFGLLENAETITACDKSGSVVPSPRPLYIPFHQKCPSLAKRVMPSQGAASHKSVDESMRFQEPF